MNQGEAVPHYTVAAGLVWDRPFSSQARLLIAKRIKSDEHGGLWEFPGGKKKLAESLHRCLARELMEELAIKVDVTEPFITVKQDYPEFSVTLHTFHCTILKGQPQAISCEQWRWVNVNDLTNYKFPEADRLVISKLQDSVNRLIRDGTK